ncbi:hypothetical protein B0T16DRAFT_325494 [Cercophora newfieldiana]|uniref:Rhodanese domain-containing protein n=1 Tax=Cercophora newfieldiana TaxID=92897 RepID=A0AA40CSH2_9PEZI|nr:hypothetical protein B0T16DRAFT_325494 [Cercophora newfieldiana]
MSAATRARRLDENADITVFEKGPYISFANCGIPYALSDTIPDPDSLLLQSPESVKKRFNIDVKINTEVVGIDREKKVVLVRPKGKEEVEEVSYDKLILSQGARPMVPDVEGVEMGHVFRLTTVVDLEGVRGYMREKGVKRAVVVGGGFIGLEAAENLKTMGLEVTVVERGEHVLPPIDRDIAEPVHAELRRNGVGLVLGKGVGKIEKDAVVVDGGERIPAELVIMVVGVRPRTGLAKAAGLDVGKNGVTVNGQMQTSDPDIYAVGDMVETEQRVTGLRQVLALAGPANRQGRMAADHIFGKDVAYRGNVGAAVVKVFGLTVGITGLSVEALQRLGREPLWVSAHPPDHASYYPGAHAITLKVAFEKETGKILGAQGVGVAGVDKRIDVLSTAIQGNMTIFDLEHLELAYAPPYGSAKDPVNMVGFIGSNLLRGDVDIAHGQDLTPEELKNMQVVDVRSPGEFSRGHLKFAKNIPVNDLRGDIASLDKSKKTLVYCQVGYRGYLADRILKQKGFDVMNLDGGYKSVADGGLKELQEVPPQKSS